MPYGAGTLTCSTTFCEGGGTPDGGFVLCWNNHDVSKRRLGYGETVRQLRKRLARCHPTNVPSVESQLAAALSHEGSTVFDWLVEIIRVHCTGGEEQEDGGRIGAEGVIRRYVWQDGGLRLRLQPALRTTIRVTRCQSEDQATSANSIRRPIQNKDQMTIPHSNSISDQSGDKRAKERRLATICLCLLIQSSLLSQPRQHMNGACVWLPIPG